MLFYKGASRFTKFLIGGGAAVGGAYGFKKFSELAQRNAIAYHGSERAEQLFGDSFSTVGMAGFGLLGAGLLGFLGAKATLKVGSKAFRRMRGLGPRSMSPGGTARGFGFIMRDPRRKPVRLQRTRRFLRHASPYAGAMALGMMSSARIYPSRIAEGNIVAIDRAPTAMKMNPRTSGLGMRRF